MTSLTKFHVERFDGSNDFGLWRVKKDSITVLYGTRIKSCVHSLDACTESGATGYVEHVEFEVESRGDQGELVESHHEAEEGQESSDEGNREVPREHNPGIVAKPVRFRYPSLAPGEHTSEKVIAWNSKTEIKDTKGLLEKVFDMEVLANKFLGMVIVRKKGSRTLRVSQSRYVQRIMGYYIMKNGGSVFMPLGARALQVFIEGLP